MEVVQRVAVTYDPEETGFDYKSGHLFALPLVLRARKCSETVVLNVEQCEGIVEVLQEAELLEEDGRVTLLPMLLPATLAERMRVGDIYHLCRMLAEEAIEEAQEFVLDLLTDEEKNLLEDPSVASTEETTLITVLMGVIESDEESPFVVAKLSEVEHDALPSPHDERHLEAHNALHEDMSEHLASTAAQLKRALGAQEVELVVPADHWFDNREVAFLLERSHNATKVLKDFAAKHCAGELQGLTTHQPTMDDGILQFPIHRRVDDAPLGLLPWPDAQNESWSHALRRLFSLLMTLGVHPQFHLEPDADEEAPAGPLH
jgi:hypothetical protein